MGGKRERVIEELVQGQECATQLQVLLSDPASYYIVNGGHGQVVEGKECVLADELVGKILSSFTRTLSELTTIPLPAGESAGEVCQNVAASPAPESGCWGDRRSEDSRESRQATTRKSQRGCYKRKKPSETWTIIASTFEDSHTWRKYGQKEILNSKFPRSYFRCTRKYEQGCKATKQVQRVEEDPQTLYRTTYIGHHTCKDILKAPPPIVSDTHPRGSCNKLDPPQDLHCPLPHYAAPANNHPVKEESRELEATTNHNMWEDLVPFASSGSEGVSRRSLGMDLVESFGFDDCGFHLDDDFFSA